MPQNGWLIFKIGLERNFEITYSTFKNIKRKSIAWKFAKCSSPSIFLNNDFPKLSIQKFSSLSILKISEFNLLNQ